MKKEKLNKDNLRGSIDTLEIVSPEIADIEHGAEYIKPLTFKLGSSDSEATLFKYIINPNEYMSEEALSFSIYRKRMEDILNKVGLTEYYKSRVDFRIDSYEDNYYELHKLNKCIILLLSLKYEVKNRYESHDPLSLKKLTVRVQNKYFEAENYNKGLQEPEGDVKNRLELRSKSLAKDKEIPALVKGWANRLDDLPKYYQELQDKCNSALVECWNMEKGKEVKTVSEFIRKYQNNIYCRKQLTAFFEAIGVSNPARAADNFKQRNRIEFFSLNDLKTYLKMIGKSLSEYLQN